jgi:hypothetical protein
MTLPRAATGIEGLDDILNGGLTPHRLYLVEGMPGSGKTTLAFPFLMEGARLGEPVLYVTLSETEEEIRAVADSHGWSLAGPSRFRSQPPTRPKPIVTGTQSSATAAKRVRAGGARTNGACPGRLRRSP